MLRQIINGRVSKTVMVGGSSADMLVLAGLIAGKIEIWDKKFEGGSQTAVPTPLNAQKFSVGKTNVDGSRHSAPFSLPHLKSGKHSNDVKLAVTGVWDADFLVTAKCDYCNVIGNSSRG